MAIDSIYLYFGRQHRYLSTIHREKYWITAEQEESILAEMFEDGKYPREIISK